MPAPPTPRSLCTQSHKTPIVVHWARLHDGTRVMEEMVDCVYALFPRANQRMRAVSIIGDVRARMRSAAEGRLPVGELDQFEPVRRHPDMWEHKWKLGKGRELRLYHAELGGQPHVVLLLFHRKEVAPRNGKTVSELQNQVLDRAADRVSVTGSSPWGHTTTACADCVNP